MLSGTLFTRNAISRRSVLASLVCSLALIATACEGTVPSATSTPTSVMGFVAAVSTSTPGQAPEVSTPTGGEVGPTTAPDDSLAIGDKQYGEVDVCDLATDDQIEVVLGQPITSTTPGEEPDNVSGGTLYFCTYLGSGLAVVISWVETSSPAAAGQALNEELAQMQADEPNASVTSQTGLGDQAFWTVTTQAAGYVVAKGGSVLSVVLGGNIGDPAAHQAALRTLTELVTAGM